MDPELLSGDVDLFAESDEDLAPLIESAGLDKARGGLYLEAGFELNFRTSPRWRRRARTLPIGHVSLTLPHPIEILDPGNGTVNQRACEIVAGNRRGPCV